MVRTWLAFAFSASWEASPTTSVWSGVAVIWMEFGETPDCAVTVWFMNSRFLQARYAALPPARTSKASGVTVAELPDMETLALLKARWEIVEYVEPLVFSWSKSPEFALVLRKP